MSHNSDLDQTDEDILTYEVSDEALEAAAGTQGAANAAVTAQYTTYSTGAYCC